MFHNLCEKWSCTLRRYDVMWPSTWVNELMCAVKYVFNNGVISECLFPQCMLQISSPAERRNTFTWQVCWVQIAHCNSDLAGEDGYFSPVSPTRLIQHRSVCHVTLLMSSSQTEHMSSDRAGVLWGLSILINVGFILRPEYELSVEHSWHTQTGK